MTSGDDELSRFEIRFGGKLSDCLILVTRKDPGSEVFALENNRSIDFEAKKTFAFCFYF
jgi:hypothetical protein